MPPFCIFSIKEFLIYDQPNTVITSCTLHAVIICIDLPTKISTAYVFSTGKTFGPLLALKEDTYIFMTIHLSCKASINSHFYFFLSKLHYFLHSEVHIGISVLLSLGGNLAPRTYIFSCENRRKISV